MPESARDQFAFMISDLCDKVLEHDPELGVCGAGTVAFQVADLHVTALSQARADALTQGRREGLEEAAKVVQRERRSRLAIDYDHKPVWFAHTEEIAREILALATAPAETQKPETGESVR